MSFPYDKQNDQRTIQRTCAVQRTCAENTQYLTKTPSEYPPVNNAVPPCLSYPWQIVVELSEFSESLFNYVPEYGNTSAALFPPGGDEADGTSINVYYWPVSKISK